jgi:hypothetical protein
MHMMRRLIHPLDPIDRHSSPASKFDHPDLQIPPLLFCQVVSLMLFSAGRERKATRTKPRRGVFRAGDATVTPLPTEKLGFTGE